MFERYIDLKNHLKVRVKSDRWVLFLLALVIQHLPLEHSDSEALEVDYYIPDEETNPNLLTNKEALLATVRQLLETAIVDSMIGISINKYLFPRFKELIVDDGKRWILKIETDSDLRQMLKSELSNEEKWLLVGQLIQASSSEPAAIEASLKEELAAFEKQFQMNVQHPRILNFNNDEKAEEWVNVLDKILAKEIRAPELNREVDEGGRFIPDGMTASEFENQLPLLKELTIARVTQLEDSDAQALLAFIYHTTQSALFPGFYITMTQSVEKDSTWSDKNREHLETICQQASQALVSYHFEDRTTHCPLLFGCEIGKDDQGRWAATFLPARDMIFTSYLFEWRHWILIAHILGLTNGHLEGDIINQTRWTYRDRVWALEDKLGVKLATDGTFVDWDGKVDPLIDRNKPFVPLRWIMRDEDSEK